MPDEAPITPKLSDFVPPEVLELVKEKLKSGVADAEATFLESKADEDALTGALGQAISTKGQRRVILTDGSICRSSVQ
jgi:hypothetical protein